MTRRQGGVDYYLDGALVKTNATAWDVDLSLVFTAGRYLTTDLDGTVESIALMNDTTGETVWQAAYSDLYDTSNPWPSPVPRNFAEEPMTWRDEKQHAPSIGEDDCEFSSATGWTVIRKARRSARFSITIRRTAASILLLPVTVRAAITASSA